MKNEDIHALVTSQVADTLRTSVYAQITSFGARNSKAVKALLDIETLKTSKNQEVDIKAAIEACQKDNDYLCICQLKSGSVQS